MTRNSSPTRGLARVSYAQLAELVRAITGLDEFASPFAYAARLRLSLMPHTGIPGVAQLSASELRWDATVPAATQRSAVAREICRFVLRALGIESNHSVLALCAVTFPFDAPPSLLLPGRKLRLIPSLPVPPSADASPLALRDRLPARGVRRR